MTFLLGVIFSTNITLMVAAMVKWGLDAVQMGNHHAFYIGDYTVSCQNG